MTGDKGVVYYKWEPLKEAKAEPVPIYEKEYEQQTASEGVDLGIVTCLAVALIGTVLSPLPGDEVAAASALLACL